VSDVTTCCQLRLLHCTQCCALCDQWRHKPGVICRWEVFTRRDVWHWMSGTVKQAIGQKVGNERLRPKVPAGVTPECAKMVRRCLHADPARRPDAKEITTWLRLRKDGMRKRRALQAEAKQSESAEYRRLSGGSGCSPSRSWSIVDSGDDEVLKCWNHGQFSLHYMEQPASLTHMSSTQRERALEHTSSFTLTLNATYQSDWEESALQGELAPINRPSPDSLLKQQGFGVVFKLGQWSSWPKIAKIDDLAEGVAVMFPEVKVGCQLTKINGEPAPATFNEAKPLLGQRPLQLEFKTVAESRGQLIQPWPTLAWSSAIDMHKMPKWIKEGLAAVSEVRKHEEQQQKLKKLAAAHAQEQLARAHARIAELERQLQMARPTVPEMES
jgi:hypothetical protein